MRTYYQEHQVAPDARLVIWHLADRLGPTSRNKLFELFPYGYVKQACKIAGMKRVRAPGARAELFAASALRGGM